MGRIDGAGRIIASLAGDVAHLERLQGVTGIPTPWLHRTLQASGLNPATATPDEVYRAYTALRSGESLNLPGKPVEYAPPARASEAGPPPMTMGEKLASDPERMKTIEEFDPDLAARVRGADSGVILDAYRQAVNAEGVRPARQMELPLGDAVTPQQAMPADQVAAESIAAQFDAAAQRMAEGSSPTRWNTPQDEYADAVTRSLARQPFIAPYTPPRMDAGPLAGDVLDDMSMRPNVTQARPPRPTQFSRRDAAAGAAVAAGTGAALMLPGRDGGAFTTGGEEDLVEESRPAPKVAATKEPPKPTVKQAPQDYSMQARALINRLNDMRRAAGGEVPEAPAMMAEINRLIAMGNEQRREPTFVPGDDASSKYKQAQELINQVNAMYRQGMTPNSPQVQGLMRQVRSLQAAGDEMRNRRAG